VWNSPQQGTICNPAVHLLHLYLVVDLSPRVGNTGSRLHFLCLSSTETVEIRLFLRLFPLGVFLPSWEKRRLLYFPAHSIKFLTKKSLKSLWEWWTLQEYYKIQLFSFLSPASGKKVFSSTWRCVDSSDICRPFHHFVRHTTSVYWGVLQRLALRLFFFHHRNLSVLAASCSACKLLFFFPCNYT